MSTAIEIRRMLIEVGPYDSLGQAVALESTARSLNGLPTYQPELDGPLWPNPLSIYWAIRPYHQHRPPITGEDTMTAKTDKPEKTEPEVIDAEVVEAEDTAAPTAPLFTTWANDKRMDAPDDFNEDQAAVHAWMEADDALRLEALETAMTLADAEELIGTARQVASEHMKRAERARNLVAIVAARLGKEATQLEAMETKKAVPVANAGARLTPKSAAPATRPIPTGSPSAADLPSAL